MELLSVVLVHCPKCNKALNVRNAQNQNVGLVRCTECKFLFRVNFINGTVENAAAAPQQGQQPPRPQQEQQTPPPMPMMAQQTPQTPQTPQNPQQEQVPYQQPLQPMMQPIGRPVAKKVVKLPPSDKTELPSIKGFEETGTIICMGKQYQLNIGQNIVGRKAHDSMATLQLETNDMYMSRQHLMINALRMQDGSIRTFLKNYRNTNDTFVNGQKLLDGEEVVIDDGAQIGIGKTVIIFKRNKK